MEQTPGSRGHGGRDGDSGARETTGEATRGTRDQRQAGLFCGQFILALTVAGVLMSLYAIGHWWFPPLASVEGAPIDTLTLIFLVLIGVVFVGVHVVMAMFVMRHADNGREERALPVAGNDRLEIAWTLTPAIILILLTIGSGIVWFGLRVEPAAARENPLTVDIMAQQFTWQAHYPGPDGKLGTVHPDLAKGDNPFGLDPNDPAAADDIVAPYGEMAFPVNQPVHIRLYARDVIHSFFVPAFRIKQDAVPGRVIDEYFTADRVGDFEVACAELCGPGHYTMRAALHILPEDEYQQWLEEQRAAQEAAKEKGQG